MTIKEFIMFDFRMFSNIPPVGHLYFFYGLAFIFLGVSITFKDLKSSELKIAGSLWLLAGFGFTHGAHEWLELYLLLQAQYISASEIFLLNLLAVFSVIISFLFLFEFGLSLIGAINKKRKSWLKWIPVILFVLWILYLWYSGFSFDMQFFKMADISSRHIFGFVGGLMTSYGLIECSAEVKSLSQPVTKRLFYAGIVFGFYSIMAGVVPSGTVFPYLQIRVEVFRGISAILIAYFIVKALNIFDIETKKKLELQLKRVAQSDKLVSLGHLAAGIAHEINNPLTNISLNVQNLKDRLKSMDSEEALRKLDAIEKNVSKASIIARELLQFSRKTEPDMKPININTVIKASLMLMEYKFKGVTVHLCLPDLPSIMGDPVKLEQVFINILDNSVGAMPVHKDICIEGSHNDGWITIKITDSGEGIAKENLTKVFDPFYSTKQVGSGTGLGLSISYGIISQHNGEIDIESVEGEGTIVTIKLPVIN
jgi:signal transduction histidine kinase